MAASRKATKAIKAAKPKAKPRRRASAAMAPNADTVWKLKLYVAGQSPKSVRAFANLRVLCEEHLKGRYQIEVIDLIEHPHMARGDQIIAIPTLVVRLPNAVQKIIGDLSETDRVLIGLALQPVS